MSDDSGTYIRTAKEMNAQADVLQRALIKPM